MINASHKNKVVKRKLGERGKFDFRKRKSPVHLVEIRK